MDRREQMARDFLSGKGADAQEYFVYFKQPQRMTGGKAPSCAEGASAQRFLDFIALSISRLASLAAALSRLS